MKILKILGLCLTILLPCALPSNARQIIEGGYATGPVDGALTIKGAKYQEYGEGFYSKWKPISELKFVKKGVIQVPRSTYFCSISMIKSDKWILPDGRHAECSARGWIYIKNQ